ncbi:RNA polymerase sigma factor SigJ [Streptomyces fuscigenes]|uniref:RNA polymerase sigma factor SigJ n=1 Tax=Streptomyces fuscigenes TaxID=1528880 RepID=UPI001F1A4201|nr:RNA polymerase sigma factor SigJ [Streptomyces fuscigenes]MCF3964552.1 RNA polymerase sigma factor SigJ [Streptomyces fuscigenes]
MAELAAFERERDHLWGIAYRITGSVADADDVLQDAWLRWQRLGDDEARSPHAYLTTVVSRLCYDQLTSARARRESYTGTWLPEPLVSEPGPEDRVTLDESLGTAMLFVLERLTPAERTAFVLHDVFSVPFAEIAEVVGRSSDSVRQLASRGRRRVRAEVPRRSVDRQESRRAVDAFLKAVMAGDFDGLLEVLDPDAVLRSDGGGKVRAARLPVIGGEKVATFMTRILRNFDPDRMRLVARDVNGAPGALLYDVTAGPVAVYAFTVGEGRIRSIYGVLNPDKLGHVPAQRQPEDDGYRLTAARGGA